MMVTAVVVLPSPLEAVTVWDVRGWTAEGVPLIKPVEGLIDRPGGSGGLTE
jgi:type IV secretory pathway protease TraF